MKLDLTPMPKAPVDQRKKWFTYQMMRYHDFVSGLTGIKFIFIMGGGALLGHFIPDTNWFIVAVCLMVVVMQRLFLVLSYFMCKNFFAEFSSAVWDVPVEGGGEHDMRVLMNRVGNYISDRKREDLYKMMEECYTDFSRKEAANEITKRQVSEKA